MLMYIPIQMNTAIFMPTIFFTILVLDDQVLLAIVHAVVIMHAKTTQEISKVIRGKKAHLLPFIVNSKVTSWVSPHFCGLILYLYTYLIVLVSLPLSFLVLYLYVVLGITHALKMNKTLEINHGKLITKSSTKLQQFHFAFFNVILVQYQYLISSSSLSSPFLQSWQQCMRNPVWRSWQQFMSWQQRVLRQCRRYLWP